MLTNDYRKMLECGSTKQGHTFPVSNVDHVVPLWLELPRDGEARPTTRIGGEVLTSDTANWCKGKWTLHLFSFVSEAQQAQQTLAAVGLSSVSEAGARASGEGILLLQLDAEGAFGCTIVDRRRVKQTPPPVGSWQVTPEIANLAALHVPCRSKQRAEALFHQVEAEFDHPEERAKVLDRLGTGPRQQPLACIRLDDVVEAANRLLEPIGAEVTCSDRRIGGVLDSLVTTLRPTLDGLVERLAHDLVVELADSGGIG